MIDQEKIDQITGPVVGQFFGLFDGVPKLTYQKLVAAAPFDKCNLLILAFVRTFEFVRPAEEGGTIYVAQFANGRDNHFQLDPNDTDGDRVSLIVETARKKNPSIRVLISLGWGKTDNDAGKAAMTPAPFADSVRTLVQAYDLDGFDIDFENATTNAAAMLALAKEIRRSLDKIASKRPKIMTITPAETKGLSADVLKIFTYVMPQTYGHGGNGTEATWYGQQLGSYSRIVYGLNSENPPDDPKTYLKDINSNHATGMFAWRLDNDSSRGGLPTFATASEMWKLLHPAAAGA